MKEKIELTPEQINYKNEQQKRIEAYIVGAKDRMGYTISKIFARGDEYVIYEVKEASDIESLKVFIDTVIEDNEEPIINFQKVKDSFDKLKSILYKLGADTSYKQRAASALVTAIRGDVEESKKTFTAIENDAVEDYKHKIYGRLFYLLGAILVASLFATSSLLIYFYRDICFFEKNRDFVLLMYAISFATFGGLFSVSLKTKEVFTQRTIAYWMYSIYGAERLIISIISGVISYTLVCSGIVLSLTQNSHESLYSMLTLAFASGFSETLIPNSLSRLEKSINEQS